MSIEKQIRIIHFGKYYPPSNGGIETVVANLCQGLVQRGVECHVIVANESRRMEENRLNGVQVHRMKTYGQLNSLPLCPEAAWTLIGKKGDIINLHVPNPIADLSYFLSRPSARLVISYHSDIINKGLFGAIHEPLLRWVFKKADVIVAASPDYAESSPVLSTFRHKIRIIPYGIQLPLQVEIDSRIQQKKDHSPNYFFLGRLVPYKGIFVLLEAMQYTLGTLWLGGTGPLEDELKLYSKNHNLDGRVKFLGKLSDEDKYQRMSACDAFILPSLNRAEAFGIVLLEAMSMGCPVIVSDLPTGVRMLVEDGVNGFRFASGNARELAQIMNKLAQNPSMARQMGEEGRRRVKERWNVQIMVDNYVELYHEVLNLRVNAKDKNENFADWAFRPGIAGRELRFGTEKKRA